MVLKKFLIWLVKNILVLLLVTLLFSSVTLDFPEFARGVFGDVFAYSSPEIQKEVVEKMADTCSSLERGNGLVTLQQICINETLMKSMEENCRNYKELKSQGYKIENEEDMKQSCAQIESGKLNASCKKLKSKNSIADFSGIGTLCKDYKAGKLNGQDFFVGVVSSPLSGQERMLDIGFLKKYNELVVYLNDNKLLFFLVLAALIAILYILINDLALFVLALSGISLSLGMIILLPYLGIIIYDKFVGIDTSSILGSIFGIVEFDFKAIISVVLLLFLRTYNSFIIAIGIILFGAGIAGKLYGKTPNKDKIKESKRKEKKKH